MVDLSQSNTHYLQAVGGGTIGLANLVDGGRYRLIIADTTSRTYSFTGCTTTYFNPANGFTAAGTRTIYDIQVLMNGTVVECYIDWKTGYN